MAVLGLFRPLSIALGLFLVLNAGASAARPSLGAGRLILNLPLNEPYLSLLLVVLAVSLLFPARRPHLRALELAVNFLFALAVVSNIARFYGMLARGSITTSLPVPLSALVLAIILAESLRLYVQPEAAPLPAVLQVLLTPAAFLFLVAGHVVTFGHTDYRRVGNATAAVILGARVYPDGRPSATLRYRLLTGIDLYEEERVRYLIMSGGTPAGSSVNEAEAMARFAIQQGVPPSHIVLDREGVTTYASALNCAAILSAGHVHRIMLVSQYYHLARAKLIFERQGLIVLTVPAKVGGKIRKNAHYLLRETVALPYYYLCCTFGERDGS
jgi:vancomycin permeability regulator SanA